MESHVTRRRRTKLLANIARARFHACEHCSQSQAFTYLECILEQCRFSKTEIRRLDGEISCPGCESYLNLSDNVADYSAQDLKAIRRLDAGFQKYLPELKKLNDFVKQYPTLSLLHPIGRRLFREISKGRAEILPPSVWLRASGGKNMTKVDFLPVDKLSRPYRFNHSGQIAFYLANDEETAVVEVLQERKTQTARIWLAELAIDRELRILNVDSLNRRSLFFEVLIHSGFLRFPRQRAGHFQPQYLLTRLVADMARQKGFDGIIYESSQEHPFKSQEIRGRNLVVFNPNFSKFVRVVRFAEYKWKQVVEDPPFNLPSMKLEKWPRRKAAGPR